MSVWRGWTGRLIVALAVGGLGCGSKPGPASVGGGGSTWVTNPSVSPGIDQGSAAWGSLGGRTRFLVWTDATPGGGCRASSSATGATFSGAIQAPGGRAVAFSWDTQDCTGGPFVLDGREYDLGRGGLFLVSVRGAETRVRQLARDPLEVDGSAAEFVARGKDDPEVKEFFAGGAVGK